jgi:hypothetical protein
VDFRVNEPGSQIVHCSTDPRMTIRQRSREAV